VPNTEPLRHTVQVLLPEHTIAKEDIDSLFTAAGRHASTSCIIVSTTNKWGRNAQDALNQSKPVTRLGVQQLNDSPIDWSKFDLRRADALECRPKKQHDPEPRWNG
jgi:predicted helicase